MKKYRKLVKILIEIKKKKNKKYTKNFLNQIEKRINQNYSITIYPEAHIWPFYTGIRNFKSVSFKYPVRLNKPVYVATNTYQVYGKNKDKFGIVTYLDGPFYPDKSLLEKDAVKSLRDVVYQTMCDRSNYSNYKNIEYKKSV